MLEPGDLQPADIAEPEVPVVGPVVTEPADTNNDTPPGDPEDKNTPAPDGGDPPKEPSFFEKFNSEFKTEFKDPDELLANVRAWREKADAPPVKAEYEYKNEFEKELSDFTTTLKDLSPDEAREKYRDWVNENLTDWTKEAANNPEGIILKDMKAKYPSLDEGEVKRLFNRKYAMPKRNPDLSEDEPDPEYDEAMTDRSIMMKADSADIASRLNEGRKKFGLGTSPEEKAAKAAKTEALRGKMKAEAEAILKDGFEIEVDKDFKFSVETSKEGKLTEDGAFIQSLMSNPAQIENMFVNEDGTWNLRAIATVGMLVQHPGKILGAKAKAMASEMAEKAIAEKRGIDNPDGSPDVSGNVSNFSLPSGVNIL